MRRGGGKKKESQPGGVCKYKSDARKCGSVTKHLRNSGINQLQESNLPTEVATYVFAPAVFSEDAGFV